MTRMQFQSNLLLVQDNLRRYALKLTQDTNDADDLVQDTSLRALTHRDKFVSDINFKGWMMTIMYNIFLNNQDRVERRRQIFDSTTDILNLSLASEGGYNTPDGAMSIREIYSAIDALSEHTRTPLPNVSQWIQIQRNSRRDEHPGGDGKKSYLLCSQGVAEVSARYALIRIRTKYINSLR